jgi:NADH-quinone oxidoreductase subunit A
MGSQNSPIDYLPIILMFIVALGFVVTTMVASHLLPFSIKYFLVAILFVLFDVEVIFMYPWAVNFKELGMLGVIEMFSFVALLLVGFYYMLSKKALKWEE